MGSTVHDVRLLSIRDNEDTERIQVTRHWHALRVNWDWDILPA